VLIEKTNARIEIANGSLGKAVALDVNGLPMNDAVAVQRRGDRIHVNLPVNALYTVVSD
jgi:hypothetical protein